MSIVHYFEYLSREDVSIRLENPSAQVHKQLYLHWFLKNGRRKIDNETSKVSYIIPLHRDNDHRAARHVYVLAGSATRMHGQADRASMHGADAGPRGLIA